MPALVAHRGGEAESESSALSDAPPSSSAFTPINRRATPAAAGERPPGPALLLASYYETPTERSRISVAAEHLCLDRDTFGVESHANPAATARTRTQNGPASSLETVSSTPVEPEKPTSAAPDRKPKRPSLPKKCLGPTLRFDHDKRRTFDPLVPLCFSKQQFDMLSVSSEPSDRAAPFHQAASPPLGGAVCQEESVGPVPTSWNATQGRQGYSYTKITEKSQPCFDADASVHSSRPLPPPNSPCKAEEFSVHIATGANASWPREGCHHQHLQDVPFTKQHTNEIPEHSDGPISPMVGISRTASCAISDRVALPPAAHPQPDAKKVSHALQGQSQGREPGDLSSSFPNALNIGSSTVEQKLKPDDATWADGGPAIANSGDEELDDFPFTESDEEALASQWPDTSCSGEVAADADSPCRDPQPSSHAALQTALRNATSPTSKAMKPIVRPSFPAQAKMRSSIIGLSTGMLLRTCFRIGEAMNEGFRAARESRPVIVELYARVGSSYRDNNPSILRFVFHDLFHDRAPFMDGIYEQNDRHANWDHQVKQFASMQNQKKMCRCVGKMRREGGKWIFIVFHICEVTEEDVEYSRGIVCS